MKNVHRIREISTLSFNERVLQEAEDLHNPLMERLKFLGIFSSNMDEFFKVRVASIHRRLEMGKKGMAALLEAVNEKARELDERFQAAYTAIVAALETEGVRLLSSADLSAQSPEVLHWLHEYFKNRVLHNLNPIIVRPGKRFPQLADGALYFGVKMWNKVPHYAILEIPEAIPRFVEAPNGCMLYVDDVIRHFLHDIFYIFNYERIEAFEFKISRDAELDVDNDFSEDYIRKMERELQQRKGGRPTRLVYDAAMPPGLLQLLMRELNIGDGDTLIGGQRYHNMKDLMRFPNHRTGLSFEKREPAPHPVLSDSLRSIIDCIRERDLLVTYPYQSFDHVVRLLREAAIDPKVTAIKMTLYRAAKRSQVVYALLNAAQNGKKVFVSIELQARFDEENNILISELLTEAGAAVTYGVPPMKVHCKLLFIQRGKESFAGLSTGNFNESTARQYVDSTLLTANRKLCNEVNAVFRFLERASKMRMPPAPRFRQLLVAPFNFRKTFNRLVAREKAKGEAGYIMLKANHLTDNRMIKRIRDAADAGVKMDFIIRTTYAMMPHPNIHAISILDRYLEHQRVYVFGRGDDRCVYMASGDLMERNFDWRIEAAFPILEPSMQDQVLQLVALQTADNVKARLLDEVQRNDYLRNDAPPHRAQDATHAYHWSLARE